MHPVGGSLLRQGLVKVRHGRHEDDRLHVVETVNPFPALGPETYVNVSEEPNHVIQNLALEKKSSIAHLNISEKNDCTSTFLKLESTCVESFQLIVKLLIGTLK